MLKPFLGLLDLCSDAELWTDRRIRQTSKQRQCSTADGACKRHVAEFWLSTYVAFDSPNVKCADDIYRKIGWCEIPTGVGRSHLSLHTLRVRSPIHLPLSKVDPTFNCEKHHRMRPPGSGVASRKKTGVDTFEAPRPTRRMRRRGREWGVFPFQPTRESGGAS